MTVLDLASFLSADGPIARRLHGYEPRPQQIEMAGAVDAALADKAQQYIEAGTGIGKSFAYLVPAIKRVLENDERVVVATNTINLQEQLIERDIPLLASVIPDEFSAVLVKGRRNYVSLRRLKLASERQDRLFPETAARRALHGLQDWVQTTSDGSIASLPRLPRPDVWDHAQSDAGNCMGRKCPQYEQCFFQRARRRMEHGDLLVCNHALFFSDLALRMTGNGFLPPYDHVILDEAHAVEEVAASHFGLSISEFRVHHLLRVLYDGGRRKGFLDALVLPEGGSALIDRTIEKVLECEAAATVFFDELVRWHRTRGPANGRIREPGIIDNLLSEPMFELGKLLALLRERVKRDADIFELTGYQSRANEIARVTQQLLDQAIDGCVYFVEGVEVAPGGAPGWRRVTLKCLAVDVAPILRERLFGENLGVVLTSATLATGPDDFRHVEKRLGTTDARTLQLGSPFDHARQMRVLVDPEMPSPGDAGYVDALAPRVEALVKSSDGGAFVLFTSFAMLRAVAARLREPLAEEGMPLIVHGEDGPPGQLLARFRDDRRSVLLGTMSFWQGVDVRGEGLRSVIITRLPFQVPDLPIVEARGEALSEAGKHPFMEDQLPRAIIRFRQGVGRLIRSGTDTGVVAILDPRFVTKRYGAAFRAALPESVEIARLDPTNAG